MGVMSFLKKYWIKVIAVVGFILALLTWFGIEPNSFKKSFIWLFNNFFKISIVIILMWLIVITKELIKLSKANIKNLRGDFQKHREVNSNVWSELRKTITKIREDLNYVYNRYEKYEKLEPDDEIRYILRVISNSKHGKMTETSINKWYSGKFKDKTIGDFRMVFDLLTIKGFLQQERGKTGYGGSYEELPFKITSKGYWYLRYRKVDEKENKNRERLR